MLGIALILSTLFVRLRDIGQVWELAAAAPLLRLADHLSRRLPAAVGAQDRVPQPVHPGAPGHPRDRPLPGPAAEQRSRPPTRSAPPVARLIPIAIALVFAFGLCALPPRGAVVRGAGLMTRRAIARQIEVVEDVPAAARAANDPQGALPPSVRGRRTSATRARRRQLRGRARRVLRDHRPERQRQEHAAEDPRRHLPAGPRDAFASTACCRRSSSSASVSTPS